VKKAVMKEKSGKILGLLSGGKKESIFWQKVLQKCTGAKRQKKRRFGKIFKKDECQIFLSKEIVLGHPCIPRVRVDTGSDKAGYEKEGRSWRRGGGDIYEAQRVKGKLHVITCDLASAAAHHLVSTNPRVRITVSKSPFFISKS
jgi:hypothetical protein